MACATPSGSVVSWPASIHREHPGCNSKHKVDGLRLRCARISLRSTPHSHTCSRFQRHKHWLSSSAAIVSNFEGQIFASQIAGTQRIRGRRRVVRPDAKMFVPGMVHFIFQFLPLLAIWQLSMQMAYFHSTLMHGAFCINNLEQKSHYYLASFRGKKVVLPFHET
jgi:hypothetical protein